MTAPVAGYPWWNHWLHRHRWQVVPSFVTQRGFRWPPMWACPCGELRDMQSFEVWGFPE